MLLFELIFKNGSRRIVFANSFAECYRKYDNLDEVNLVTIH